MNYLAPDLAMVPKHEIKSALVIPIPVSLITSKFFSGNGVISILNSFYSPNMSLFVKDKNDILSHASDAFDISSLRNISLVE